MGRTGGIRRRKRNHQKAVASEFCRLSERLREGELCLKAARGQVTLVVELARIGDPFVDQHHARPVVLEQLAQHVAGTGSTLIIRADALVGLLSAELPGKLAPQRADDDAVRFRDGIARRDLVAHEHGATRRRKLRNLGLGHHGIYTRQLSGTCARKQVVKREHRVRLAAAEVSLELHDRVAALAGEALHCADEKAFETFGQKRASKELGGLAVLVTALAEVYLPQIGRELGLLIT